MRLIHGLVLAVALLAVGCQKKEPAPQKSAATQPDASVALVPASERSSHFAAVNRHLELGGEFYAYADIDGDLARVAEKMKQMAGGMASSQPQLAMVANLDFAGILGDLGLTDIKAAGLSSVRDAKGGYRNQVFFYMPSGRRGLLAGLGGPAAAYQHTALAPADADVFAEGEFDLPAVYASLKAVFARVAGPELAAQIEEKIKSAGAPAGISALQVIQSAKGRGVVVMRLDPEKTYTIPARKPLTIPAFSYLIRIDGIGAALEPAIAQIPILAKAQDGTLNTYTFNQPLPFEGLKPMLAIENGALYFATSPEFFAECRAGKTRLDQTPAYKNGLARVGSEGNGLGYVSPRFFARLRQLPGMNPDAAPEVKRTLDLIASQFPEVSEPVVTQRINLPDGILIRSHNYRSLKQDVAMLAVYNPVTIGAMAAMAVPAFNKVRMKSQERQMQTGSEEKQVQENLRMLSAAAEQYYLENNVKITTYDRLVGPGKYIPAITPVAGENYRSVSFRQGQPLKVRLSNGSFVEYKP